MNAAERIYFASTREDGRAARLAERLARRIEDDIASRRVPPGGALGSLRDLSERYAAGRATTREAVGLLERRGLGQLRPGPCGGFIVRKPRSEEIAEELAGYFRTVDVTSKQLLDACEAIDLMAVRLATAAPIEVTNLAGLHDIGVVDRLSALQAVRAEIARLTGEPTVILMVECLNRLIGDFGDLSRTLPIGPQHPVPDMTTLREALARNEVDCATRQVGLLHAALAACVQAPKPHPEETASAAGPGESKTLAASVARRLTIEIIRNAAIGQRLGSEWDLCERFSVSRLTLRQAIRILQDSGLVECRRGRGNGLVVRARSGTGPLRLVLAHLIGRQLDVRVAGTILFQLNCYVPALAVSGATAQQRAALATLLGQIERSDSFDRYDLLNLVHYVSELADNPIIDLFSRCLAAYEARFHPSLAQRLPVSVQAKYFELMRDLMDAGSPETPGYLTRAKELSARVMLEMSRTRPI